MEWDKKKYRLVKSAVGVKISFGELVLKGLTTGLDTNGLGARVNISDYSPDPAAAGSKDIKLCSGILKQFIGEKCRVSFLSEKLFFMDVFGSLLRAEKSREPDYTNFVAVEFLEGKLGLLESDRQKLVEYIELQNK